MITRRGFLAATAFVVSVPMPVSAAARDLRPNVFVRLTSDGEITVTVPRPDTGQGARTAAVLLVAEELSVDPDRVVVEQAPGDTAKYGPQMVAGSSSVQQMFQPLRTAGATARCLLVAAAAARWGVPSGECQARDGFVVHPSRGRLAYADLVADAAAIDPASVPVTLKPPREWRVLGRPRVRVDVHDVTSGKAKFGIDVSEPRTAVAVVARPPWLGATVASIDDAAARAVEGVVAVVPLDSAGVAVVANRTAAALAGRAALRVTWTGGNTAADSRDWLTELGQALPAPPTAPGTVALQATYRLPLLAHAPMEPHNATASLTADGKLTVWAPTQDPGGTRERLAQILRLPLGDVSVFATLAGGGFGRRAEFDVVLEAVTCSRAVQRPVKVLWTRDDDMRHDSYRPMSVHRLSAVVGPTGLPTWRSHEVATWPLTVVPFFNDPALVRASGDHFPYRVPGEVSIALRPAPLRTGFWRAVYAGQFGYAEECFLSALAARAKIDQVAFRQRLLPPDSRLVPLLRQAARAHCRPGHHRGVACHVDYDSAIAVVADVGVRAGRPTVERVTAAVDVGVAVHPSGVRAQVEGGVMDAVSTVLGAQITVREGRVVESSFRDYRWARIDEAPDIDVIIAASDRPPGGLGELAYPPAAAAIASAVASATGRAVTGMPVTGEVG
ncbi:xanthine dehydrogenase family protein molybdopterin-binding subunit [Kibdelosporangium persicum]|uniref:Isoquinoline 1-oxidoreductase beta subunit n=1 Tax=Kibdelosporangium persicum TaxID=2698649 RepID=A0ABX2F5F7_9PSEU|nr:molybdopterin cofactor-binding domain-containing protein [Kibdelosporangium persicum]NRN66487.1 Isoquinoline 1-oxidoreductase beta subunit [Kibdelosporangium persicum]